MTKRPPIVPPTTVQFTESTTRADELEVHVTEQKEFPTGNYANIREDMDYVAEAAAKAVSNVLEDNCFIVPLEARPFYAGVLRYVEAKEKKDEELFDLFGTADVLAYAKQSGELKRVAYYQKLLSEAERI